MEAQKLLAERGIPVRVVSMPCRERFDRQEEAIAMKCFRRMLGPRRRGGGPPDGLGSLCRRRGTGDRHRPLGRLRPGGRVMKLVRFHGGERGDHVLRLLD